MDDLPKDPKIAGLPGQIRDWRVRVGIGMGGIHQMNKRLASPRTRRCIAAVTATRCRFAVTLVAAIVASASVVAEASVLLDIDNICADGIKSDRTGWWGSGFDPGTELPGSVWVTDASVLGISLSLEGPFVSSLDVIYRQGDDGVLYAPVIYKKGLGIGESNEHYAVDIAPSWFAWHQEWTVYRMKSVGFDSSPLLSSNPGPGGGLRIFPDKDSPSDSTDRQTLSITAEIEPPTDGAIVRFAAFDVDDPDPKLDYTSVDPNGDEGDDNFGGAGSLSNTRVAVDSLGVASTDYSVSMNPGDNVRVVASCDYGVLNGITVQGTNLLDSDGNQLDTDGAMATEMVTTWRRLHIELDKMEPVPTELFSSLSENRASGTILAKGTKNTKQGLTKISVTDVHVDGLAGATTLAADRFENGLIAIPDLPGAQKTFPVVGNSRTGIEVPFFGGNPAFGENPGTVLGGLRFELYDDDDFDGDDLFVNGDAADGPIDDPNLHALMQDSSNPEQNVYAKAYIVPKWDCGGDSSYCETVPFDLNVEDSEVPSRDAWRDSSSNEASDYWVAYVQIGYQGKAGKDEDPETEDASEGTTPSDASNRLGKAGVPPGGDLSMIYLETTIDSSRGCGGVLNLRTTLPHEVGHQFGLHGDDARGTFGIMSYYGCEDSISLDFAPDHLKILRSRTNSPGH